MMNAGNPMDVITNKLDSINQKLDGLGKGNDNSEEIAQIKKDISSIAASMAALASTIETEEVRKEKQNTMTDDIVAGVNGKIGSLQQSMSDFDEKVKKTQFKAALSPDQYKTMQDLKGALSKDDMQANIKQLNEASGKVKKSVETFQNTVNSTLKEGMDNLTKSVEIGLDDVYAKVESKREQEGKYMVMSTFTFYTIFVICFVCFDFGFWGMTKVMDHNSALLILFFIVVAIIFISGLHAWMKFKDWRDKRHRYY